MPHFKCVACKTRLYSAVGPDDLVGDLCPGCGSLLEPVGELAEIVWFRSIRDRDSAVDDSSPGTHQRIAGRVDDFFARREAFLESPARGATAPSTNSTTWAGPRPVMTKVCPSCQQRLPTIPGLLSPEMQP